MVQSHHYASLLLITNSNETAAQFAGLLPADRFAPELSVCAPREASYVLGETAFDVVVIDESVPSDDGARLGMEAAKSGAAGVLFLAGPDLFETTSRYAEAHGFMALKSPADPVLLRQSLNMMAAVSDRLHQLESKAESLEAKMEEMRLVNRAKLILIQQFKMTEKDAHRFIEKNAMDRCVKRRVIAENIIRTYQI
ncbi:MAG: ANTAR domain-containing protein [Oscillospiraceae bacterium]|nr:ANTAR domain-containing protein [Oscillospiraceae bacterium]